MKATVKKGKRYQAVIEIPWLKRGFANAAVVADRLKEAGFSSVHVVDKGKGTYIATGTWNHDDATEEVDYVVSVKEI